MDTVWFGYVSCLFGYKMKMISAVRCFSHPKQPKRLAVNKSRFFVESACSKVRHSCCRATLWQGFNLSVTLGLGKSCTNSEAVFDITEILLNEKYSKNFSGSNTDGVFTTAVSNSYLSP